MDPDVTFLNYSEPWTCTPYKQKAFTSILNPMGSQFYDITEQNNTYYSDLINRTFMLLVIGDNYKNFNRSKNLKRDGTATMAKRLLMTLYIEQNLFYLNSISPLKYFLQEETRYRLNTTRMMTTW